MLTYSKLSAGDVIVAEDGHDCLELGAKVVVKSNEGFFYVPCARGLHFLSPDIDDDHVAGFSHLEERDASHMR